MASELILEKEYKRWRPDVGWKTWDGFLKWREGNLLPSKVISSPMFFRDTEVHIEVDELPVIQAYQANMVSESEVGSVLCNTLDVPDEFMEADVLDLTDEKVVDIVTNMSVKIEDSFIENQLDPQMSSGADVRVLKRNSLVQTFDYEEQRGKRIICRERIGIVPGRVHEALSFNSHCLCDTQWVSAYVRQFKYYQLIGCVLEYVPKVYIQKPSSITGEITYGGHSLKMGLDMTKVTRFPIECQYCPIDLVDGILSKTINQFGYGSMDIQMETLQIDTDVVAEFWVTYEVELFVTYVDVDQVIFVEDLISRVCRAMSSPYEALKRILSEGRLKWRLIVGDELESSVCLNYNIVGTTIRGAISVSRSRGLHDGVFSMLAQIDIACLMIDIDLLRAKLLLQANVGYSPLRSVMIDSAREARGYSGRMSSQLYESGQQLVRLLDARYDRAKLRNNLLPRGVLVPGCRESTQGFVKRTPWGDW